MITWRVDQANMQIHMASVGSGMSEAIVASVCLADDREGETRQVFASLPKTFGDGQVQRLIGNPGFPYALAANLQNSLRAVVTPALHSIGRRRIECR
ncbi:hypothetical protein [Asticcacaulis sp. 201]|uniref:hypothetical protein n=1 Tax=Asticcacaulis sp. 201 TaxID=3028787 RepID=UPI002915E346|nr:hypothetical protein [Asticcacaulis sp. 201]MDV6331024.1 hypothetical protein [Asticcacaulis sp. 201]